jgi:hypothetical protein
MLDCMKAFFQRHGFADDALYSRGDFFLERTQTLEIRRAECFCRDLVLTLQSWMRTNNLFNWRVIIPTYTVFECLIVYPDCFCVRRQCFTEWCLDERAVQEAIRAVRPGVQES